MRSVTILLLVPLFCVPVSMASTSIPAGPVSGLWTQAGSPYQIEGEIFISVDDALFIEPGCQIVFMGHYKLRVLGRLVATGTEVDNVSFDAADPTTGWHGIRFFDTTTNGQDPSVLTYCVLRNGRAVGASGADQDGGAIYCYRSANVLFRHCTFVDNYAADEGGALFLDLQSDIRVEETRFLNNEAYFSGGAIHCHSSAPVIVNSVLDSNASTIFAGGIAAWYDAHFRLENVKVINCTAGTVCGFYSVASNPVMVGCLFAGNTSTLGSGGGGGLTSGSNVRLINTTIANNTSYQGGGGVWVYVSSATITNSIVWMNQPDEIAPAGGSTVTVSYSDVFGGWPGVGNLNLNPDFVGIGPDPYAPGETSPCVDSANPDTTGLGLPELDLAGHPRVVNGRVDMGAYEYIDAGGVAAPGTPVAAMAARCMPNPFGPATTITYDLPAAAPVTLHICDVEGRHVRVLLDRARQEAGQQRVTWDGRNDASERMPAGRYLYVLTVGAQRLVRAVALLK